MEDGGPAAPREISPEKFSHSTPEPQWIQREHIADSRKQVLPLPGERAGVRASVKPFSTIWFHYFKALYLERRFVEIPRNRSRIRAERRRRYGN
jgi:hypothetical protein